MNSSGWCCRSRCPSPIGCPTVGGDENESELCRACVDATPGRVWPAGA